MLAIIVGERVCSDETIGAGTVQNAMPSGVGCFARVNELQCAVIVERRHRGGCRSARSNVARGMGASDGCRVEHTLGVEG